MTTKITLAMLRAEAARVFGAEAQSDVYDYDAGGLRGISGPSLRVWLSGRRTIEFTGRSKAGARRLAYEVLSMLPSEEGGA